MMDYSFPRYLLAKQTVDERALNQHVFNALCQVLPRRPLRIIEVGGGNGTMIPRLWKWNLLQQAEYTLVDELPENIASAEAALPLWAETTGLSVERSAPRSLRFSAPPRELRLNLTQADVFDYIHSAPRPADLLIAHAFLDLLPMPASLPRLFSLLQPGGLAWLTINFDGVTTLEPPLDPALEAQLEQLYHETMDTRPSGGDSRSGRHLFGHLKQAGAEILAAGASDWVVYPHQGRYPADEAYFLHFILHFFESSLAHHPQLDAAAFARGLAARHAQIERGELVYIAHQLDFLVAPQPRPGADV